MNVFWGYRAKLSRGYISGETHAGRVAHAI
jgi:hypothetical protein